MTMNCYSWRGRKGNVRDHTERPQALIWKPILIWIPKFILISFLKKGAMFIKNVLHVKFTRQKHALLKSLLGKEEHILLQNVKMKKFLLQISISFFNKKLGILLHPFKQQSFQRSSRWQTNSYAPSRCYPWAIWRKLITAATTSTSTLDGIPTRIVKSSNELLSVVLNLINFSLEKRIFPQAFKQAVAKPYIKNVNLDSKDFANYWRISNLSYTSKLLERSAIVQLTDHPESNAIESLYYPIFGIGQQKLATKTAKKNKSNSARERCP